MMCAKKTSALFFYLAIAWILPTGCATTTPTTKTTRTVSVTHFGERSKTNSQMESSSPGRSEASRRCEELLPLIEKVAKESGLDTALLVGIVRTESNFRNDVRSGVGARGLTQCMPATARAKKCGPLEDPYENLKCGARVIQAFLKYYDNSVYLGLSGYNAGHGMPNRARKTKELPSNVDYVEKVLAASSRFQSRGCDF